jgi:ribulose-phosphate 3-epimerase
VWSIPVVISPSCQLAFTWLLLPLMPGPYLISTSILSADFTRLGEQIHAVEAAGADWIHVDVMDGHFVSNLTMGPFIVAACRSITTLPLDVHLMVEDPDRLVEPFARAGASLLSVHVESHPHLHRTLHHIRQLGCRVGVVLNPGTPALLVEPVLHLVDLVLVMSVNPGASGQTFIPEVLPKVTEIRRMLDRLNPQAMVEIDGGITPQILPAALKAGVQVIVSASAVFKNPAGIAAGIRALQDCFPPGS